MKLLAAKDSELDLLTINPQLQRGINAPSVKMVICHLPSKNKFANILGLDFANRGNYVEPREAVIVKLLCASELGIIRSRLLPIAEQVFVCPVVRL